MKAAAQIFVKFYRYLSPALHFLSQSAGYPSQCRFPISCSEFCEETLKENSLAKALPMILKRLLLCGPWARLN